MRAVARLVWLYFVLLPVQRVLLIPAVGFVVLGALAWWPGGAPFEVIQGMMVFSAVLIVTPLFLAAGFVFGVLSKPRGHRLLPRFHARLLIATCLVVMVPSIAIAPLAYGEGGIPEAARAFVYVAVLFSVLLWLQFVLRISSMLIAVMVPLVLLTGAGMLFELVERGDHPSLLAAVIAVVLMIGWGLFAAWYPRRAGTMERRRESHASWPAPERRREPPLAVTPAAATASFLRDGQTSRIMPLIGVAFWIALVEGVLVALGSVTTQRGFLAVPLLFATGGAFGAWRLAARSRLLWLKSTYSRDRLFGLLEKEILVTDSAQVVVAVVVTAAFAWAFTPELLFALPATGLCALATYASGAYLAATWGQGPRVADVALAAVCAGGLGVVMVSVLLNPPATDVLMWAAAALGACALLCRQRARQRWRTVDWTRVPIPRFVRPA